MQLPINAQVLDLRLAYVSEIGAGYDASTRAYDPDFITSNLTEPKHRPVRAHICNSLASAKVKMIQTGDGARCKDQRLLTLPDGVTSFVLTLTAPGLIRNRRIELEKFIVSSERYRGPGSCQPSKPIRVATNCGTTFQVPLPSDITVGGPPQHSILVEARAGDQIIKTQSKPVVVPRWVPLIVSVGESLASGQGNPDGRGRSKRQLDNPTSQRDCFDDTTVMLLPETDMKPLMREEPTWYDKEDYRSLRSGPAQAARKLLDRWPYLVFLSFAKSGATVPDIVEQLGKVKATVGNHKIDALLISAGGNDVGFSNVLEEMSGDFIDKGAERAMSEFLRKIVTLREKEYPKLEKAIIGEKLNVSEVLINEYPGKLFNRANGQPDRGCGVFDTVRFWGVKKRDAVAMNAMGDLLNAEVKLLAGKHNWHFVGGISDQFSTHGYCSSRSFYRSAEDSCDMQGDFQGTMHPNYQGTLVYARALERELRKVLPEPERPGFEP
jgi:lysophospholipase L1-like esterase